MKKKPVVDSHIWTALDVCCICSLSRQTVIDQQLACDPDRRDQERLAVEAFNRVLNARETRNGGF